MQKLSRTMWIRLGALIVLVVSLFLFSESFFIGNYIEKITGTKGQGSISLVGLLKGEIVLKDISIYSPRKYYNGVKAIYINEMTLVPRWLTLFSKDKTINAVNVNGLVINNIYAYDNDNNIQDILEHSLQYFANKKRSTERCSVRSFSVTNIAMNTFHKGNSSAPVFLPDIHVKNVRSNNSIATSIGLLLGQRLSLAFDKNDGRSFWQKAGDVFGAGLATTTSMAQAGSVLLDTAASIANQTDMMIDNFK